MWIQSFNNPKIPTIKTSNLVTQKPKKEEKRWKIFEKETPFSIDKQRETFQKEAKDHLKTLYNNNSIWIESRKEA